jgi:hypothetical protein
MVMENGKGTTVPFSQWCVLEFTFYRLFRIFLLSACLSRSHLLANTANPLRALSRAIARISCLRFALDEWLFALFVQDLFAEYD